MSTTVKGPPIGKLKPLEEVDMEPMTDAFLTASVLAAVAKGSEGKSTTRITGIANQVGIFGDLSILSGIFPVSLLQRHALQDNAYPRPEMLIVDLNTAC